MIKRMDITNRKFAEVVLGIQVVSYKVEAELIDCYDIPPLKETVSMLQQCGEIFYGYYISNELCGVISIKVEEEIVDIHRLMVYPKYFRKGIARALLNFVEKNVGKIKKVIVSTGSKNMPAINFYKNCGFSKTGEIRVTEYLSLTAFEKIIDHY